MNIISMAKCYSMGKTWFKMEGHIEQGKVYTPGVNRMAQVLFNIHIRAFKNEIMSNKRFGHKAGWQSKRQKCSSHEATEFGRLQHRAFS